MYYLIEVWTGSDCETSKALGCTHAKEIAQSIYEEEVATSEAAGLIPDITITIHQCIQVIPFIPKEK